MKEKANLFIDQKLYSDLEVDIREYDIVQIWMNNKVESNVIQIERENLKELIAILQKEVNK